MEKSRSVDAPQHDEDDEKDEDKYKDMPPLTRTGYNSDIEEDLLEKDIDFGSEEVLSQSGNPQAIIYEFEHFIANLSDVKLKGTIYGCQAIIVQIYQFIF